MSSKYEHRKEYIKRIRALRLIDDDFMNIFFKNNIEGTELVLKIILDRDDLKVTEVKTQERLENIAGHSCILDIYATDLNGDKYNIEVQRADTGAIPQRVRFHAGLITTNILMKGDQYSELKEVYVIFITENDVIGLGEPIYHIDKIIREGKVDFKDGTNIIYVNASIKSSDTPLGRLMHDFYCTDAKDMNYKVLADKVRYYKETEEGEAVMCDILDEMRNEARLECNSSNCIE